MGLAFAEIYPCSFKQEKFNLLREQNEGYAKLIVNLCESHATRGKTHERTFDDILCLIGALLLGYIPLKRGHSSPGQFRLDPNRVTDIVLEAFEHSLDRADSFCHLLSGLRVTSSDICNIVAFKLQPYQVGSCLIALRAILYVAEERRCGSA